VEAEIDERKYIPIIGENCMERVDRDGVTRLIVTALDSLPGNYWRQIGDYIYRDIAKEMEQGNKEDEIRWEMQNSKDEWSLRRRGGWCDHQYVTYVLFVYICLYCIFPRDPRYIVP
jgi:hypothetical protein